MISAQDALARILEEAFVLPPEPVVVSESVDRVLAEDLYAKDNLPPFSNSAMDGFAVRVEDLKGAGKENPVKLKVQEVVRAGMPAKEKIVPGCAVKLMTGAPVPMESDAVVMKELTEEKNGEVWFFHEPGPGENIRPEGEDVKKGSLFLRKGTLIRPYEIALLAAEGISPVPVYKSPEIGILATGDELLEPSSPLSEGMIRNSNTPAISALLKRWGYKVHDEGIAPDLPEKIEKILGQSLRTRDVILVSGGVSVGDFDYTKPIIEKLGARIVFWKVAIKPGKPLLFALYEKGETRRYVFGLPGNPLAAMVCVEEFIRPLLEKLKGLEISYPSYHLKGAAVNAYPKHDPQRQQYLFCKASFENEEFRLKIIRPQGSAMMGMACQANALAVSPPGRSRIEPGDLLSFRWIK